MQICFKAFISSRSKSHTHSLCPSAVEYQKHRPSFKLRREECVLGGGGGNLWPTSCSAADSLGGRVSSQSSDCTWPDYVIFTYCHTRTQTAEQDSTSLYPNTIYKRKKNDRDKPNFCFCTCHLCQWDHQKPWTDVWASWVHWKPTPDLCQTFCCNEKKKETNMDLDKQENHRDKKNKYHRLQLKHGRSYMNVARFEAHSRSFCALGEAKGLRKAAMRTSCLLPPPVLTPRTPASGVFRPLEPGVRPGVAALLGVRLGVAARPGVRLGVRNLDSSSSSVLPGVATKHSSRASSLFFCNLWMKEGEMMMIMMMKRDWNSKYFISILPNRLTWQHTHTHLPDTPRWWSSEHCE